MSNKPFEKPDCTKCAYQNNCPCGWSNCNSACLTIYKQKDRNCGNCKYWADNEVCVCADSEQVADFTDKDFYCKCHKYAEVNRMSEKLKSCPFCGGEVTVAIGGDDEEQFYFITRGNKENKCTCRVFMESERFSADIDDSEKEKIRQELINSWNRRVCKCRKEN